MCERDAERLVNTVNGGILSLKKDGWSDCDERCSWRRRYRRDTVPV